MSKSGCHAEVHDLCRQPLALPAFIAAREWTAQAAARWQTQPGINQSAWATLSATPGPGVLSSGKPATLRVPTDLRASFKAAGLVLLKQVSMRNPPIRLEGPIQGVCRAHVHDCR